MSEATQTENLQPLELEDITIIKDDQFKKAITAAALGNAIEWFDFGVYGFLAYVLGKVFFPEASPSVQLVASLATFSVPFLVRPLGGIFFGVLGDKFGRQKILAITIIIMSVSTFSIGLIPSYATIGIWAPVLLLIAKLAQGFSVGGEYTGAAIFVAEYAPDRKRGFLGSWLDFGSIAGFVLGAGVVVVITMLLGQERFEEWGWRIPFFIAGPLGIIGMYLRSALDETPTFQKHTESLEKGEGEEKESLLQIIRNNFKSILVCIGLVMATNVTYYMLLTYMPSYLSHNLEYSVDHGVLIIITIMLGILVIQPVIGLLSDRFGRRIFVQMGSIGLFVCAIPAFYLINTGNVVLIFLGLMVLATLLSCFTGVTASILPAIFPTHVRYSAMAIAFNISVLIAGFTPTIAAWLVETTHNLYMPAYYLMVIAGVGFITVYHMKETANRPLSGETPVASNRREAKEILQAHYDRIEGKIESIDEEIARLQKRREQLILQHPEIDE
ncbi:glycine betaine/L-proline transporter ProP [Wohlfahrtiimonas chitiniclastica]|uniref:glycine betaine/L-proline transporter ProP n=1 Tax=Wohlfahrtiimonas chitiniclastica TaxID=400946 RepID=UPI001BCBB07A|nr:glycine betaine/L-proline transporter ProP [Wohlfahrtiimonas chitiniclastica]MBS7817673.1 glycine betaine/L-proline transporter ProP [Wohlfahrtiimonas chitiniclastica]MBS7823489.1 glycine betaine/L-proline transporter ProP [Wohlfahrtiimonas chitiniclastica]MBS7831303.1 glycine betaine/L-proline transporter ProP [Wohlfahrtiimonas chitiniclastica]MBS7833270.1 glycine betaine/L-proline transporter ProP [Wohlfahrtiimonas chitiniclastica]